MGRKKKKARVKSQPGQPNWAQYASSRPRRSKKSVQYGVTASPDAGGAKRALVMIREHRKYLESYSLDMKGCPILELHVFASTSLQCNMSCLEAYALSDGIVYLCGSARCGDSIKWWEAFVRSCPGGRLMSVEFWVAKARVGVYFYIPRSEMEVMGKEMRARPDLKISWGDRNLVMNSSIPPNSRLF